MATYTRQRYLLMSTGPVHIGTGGYRLGRVDNSIVREPGTRVPKIPGTSLHGAVRAYAASQYGSIQCGGQKNHCGEPTCPICYTFGSLEGEGDTARAFSGVVNIFDAHVVLFPVHSMYGPVWVSTPGRLEDADFEIKAVQDGAPVPEVPLQGGLFTWERKDALNLGWLMVTVAGEVTVGPPKKTKWEDTKQWKAVQDRLVLVNESLFSQVVNSNLEVRTSVAIDPERGAAEDKALFTYEALPRATFLVNEVVLDDYREAFPNIERLKGWLRLDGHDLPAEERKRLAQAGWKDEAAREALKKMSLPWDDSLGVVRAGLDLIAWLGVGGMGTRGFGRLAIVGEPREEQ